MSQVKLKKEDIVCICIAVTLQDKS